MPKILAISGSLRSKSFNTMLLRTVVELGPVLRALRMVPFFGAHVGIANAAKVFDEHGTRQDAAVRTQVEKYIASFAEFSSRHKRPRT